MQIQAISSAACRNTQTFGKRDERIPDRPVTVQELYKEVDALKADIEGMKAQNEKLLRKQNRMIGATMQSLGKLIRTSSTPMDYYEEFCKNAANLEYSYSFDTNSSAKRPKNVVRI